MNQHGCVQSVGAVSEKIEGFFDVCRLRGLEGQGVVIPAANVEHLMLRDEVVQAAAQGRFHVYAVSDVDEAIELLTGVAAGEPDSKGGLPEGSVNRLVALKLAHMSDVRRAFAGVPSREAAQVPKRLPMPTGVARRSGPQKPG